MNVIQISILDFQHVLSTKLCAVSEDLYKSLAGGDGSQNDN